eukprot:TRINITY_DN11432_c0_g1_i2.p2 TRINITY_DN11432_c0_g1~~TRINITY_DN11432_c0_g1_i2.p2  ORF type:complete len:110 (-),score=3.81 TRINITY_DN11432_c0_g1_i2:197-526(-)
MKKKREVQREKYLASKKCNKTRVVRLLSRQPLSQRVFKELFFVYPRDYRKKTTKNATPTKCTPLPTTTSLSLQPLMELVHFNHILSFFLFPFPFFGFLLFSSSLFLGTN